jgi:hypothetical protein
MTKKKSSTRFQARQGDVFIERVPDADVAKLTRLDDGSGCVILAHGEVTGHTHRLETRHASLYLEDSQLSAPEVGTLIGRIGGGLIPDRLLVLEAPGTLVHEEHGPIDLPAGTYRIRIQREYSPAELRNVAD